MIYFDNAATTFPKPPEVIDAVCSLMREYGGNPGRGGHRLSRLCGEKIYECRENFARLIGAENPERIIFTKNTTEALNLAIKGTLSQGDEVIISSMEHNSVLRSAVSMEKRGVTLKIAKKRNIAKAGALQRRRQLLAGVAALGLLLVAAAIAAVGIFFKYRKQQPAQPAFCVKIVLPGAKACALLGFFF